MTRFGLDSTGMVPVAAHHAVGSTVALRYLSRSTGKVITRGEHAAYKRAGIDLVLVFEDMGRPDHAGYDGGKADAEFALRQATDILGTPALAPCIRFAADYDPAGQAHLTDGYYDGVAAVMHRSHCGPYGGDEIIRHQADRGFQSLWATYAWSGGRVDRRVLAAGAYQYANGHTVAGHGVDYNHLYGSDFGQWDRKAAVPADPQHYHRFDTAIRQLDCGHVSELAAVLEYDRLRKHPLVHQPRLRTLRQQLFALAGRVYAVAHESDGGWGALPAWAPFHRGWRYQELAHRAQGQRVA